jgi:hypothetical protein
MRNSTDDAGEFNERASPRFNGQARYRRGLADGAGGN